MEIIVLIAIGLSTGVMAQLGFGAKEYRGAYLLPAVGTLAAAGTWAILTWTPLVSTGWAWLISIVVTALAIILTVVFTKRVREASDEAALSGKA